MMFYDYKSFVFVNGEGGVPSDCLPPPRGWWRATVSGVNALWKRLRVDSIYYYIIIVITIMNIYK